MSARIIEILAAMAMKKTLGPLHVVSENQKTISAVVLERHLDRISDDLGGYAHSLRIEYETLRTANQRLEGEVARLHKLLGWMSTNTKEGWDEVCRIGAVAVYESHETALNYLDSLPEASVALAALRGNGVSE
jgi:hypothetical protein